MHVFSRKKRSKNFILKKKKPNFQYFKNYNNFLSEVSNEFDNSFASIASPTLSKQETVTNLFKTINKSISNGLNKPSFPWKRLIQFTPRLILQFIAVLHASLRFRVKNLPLNAVYFRTWLVPRCFSNNILCDDYFRQLPIDIGDTEKVVTGFSSLNFSLLNQFAYSDKKNNQIIDYGLLNVLDIIKLFIDFTFNGLMILKNKYYLEGFELSSFINNSLLLDYLELRSFEAYVSKFICQKLKNNEIKAFIYIFENQSWEKAYCANFKNSNIPLIGYQSSGFSPLFLNFFPTKIDANRDFMPDIILTVGNNFQKYLIDHGNYKNPIESFAALRFSYPASNGKYDILAPNPNILDRILYALPVHIEDYRYIINDLIKVFLNSKIEIHLKPHPLYSFKSFNDILPLPKNFKIINDLNINSLKDNYDCVLFHDNSFGVEALIKGVKSYQYSRDGNFSNNRFFYFDLWNVNYKLSNIFKLKESIEKRTYQKMYDVDTISEYVNSMYCPYTPDSLIRFDKIINIEDKKDLFKI